jgi:hypothetical protein
MEVCSRNVENRTPSHREWSQRPEFTMFNTLVLAPNVISGEIEVPSRVEIGVGADSRLRKIHVLSSIESRVPSKLCSKE